MSIFFLLDKETLHISQALNDSQLCKLMDEIEQIPMDSNNANWTTGTNSVSIVFRYCSIHDYDNFMNKLCVPQIHKHSKQICMSNLISYASSCYKILVLSAENGPFVCHIDGIKRIAHLLSYAIDGIGVNREHSMHTPFNPTNLLIANLQCMLEPKWMLFIIFLCFKIPYCRRLSSQHIHNAYHMPMNAIIFHIQCPPLKTDLCQDCHLLSLPLASFNIW